MGSHTFFPRERQKHINTNSKRYSKQMIKILNQEIVERIHNNTILYQALFAFQKSYFQATYSSKLPKFIVEMVHLEKNER